MSDSDEGVRVVRVGPVTTIIMSRPERRNAVDGPMAAALRGAFRQFELALLAVMRIVEEGAPESYQGG
jgi:enoyl-CoA hydratase/carnithine racemase